MKICVLVFSLAVISSSSVVFADDHPNNAFVQCAESIITFDLKLRRDGI